MHSFTRSISGITVLTPLPMGTDVGLDVDCRGRSLKRAFATLMDQGRCSINWPNAYWRMQVRSLPSALEFIHGRVAPTGTASRSPCIGVSVPESKVTV